MRLLGLLTACLVAACASPASPVAQATPVDTPAAFACVNDRMTHVYHADRLQVLSPCVTVAGVVDAVRAEADGDYHVLIRLDPGQTCAGHNCLDAANLSEERGDLVTEPVCEHAITQEDAVAACAGYHNPLAIPDLGAHVTVTGPWVLDLDHGWDEIHPVERFGSL